jgi:hypothetical protein
MPTDPHCPACSDCHRHAVEPGEVPPGGDCDAEETERGPRYCCVECPGYDAEPELHVYCTSHFPGDKA